MSRRRRRIDDVSSRRRLLKTKPPRSAAEAFLRLGRRTPRGVLERKNAGDGCALSHGRFDRHCAAVQFHERAHQREAEAGAAMLRAKRIGFEPVEYAVLLVGWNAGAAV